MTKDLNGFFAEGLARAAGDDALTDGRDLVAASARAKARNRRAVRASGLTALAAVAIAGVGLGSFTLVDQRNSAGQQLSEVTLTDIPTFRPEATLSPPTPTMPAIDGGTAVLVDDVASAGTLFARPQATYTLGEPLALAEFDDYPVYAVTDQVWDAVGSGWAVTSVSNDDALLVLLRSASGDTFLVARLVHDELFPVAPEYHDIYTVRGWFAQDDTVMIEHGGDHSRTVSLYDLRSGELSKVPARATSYSGGDWLRLGTAASGVQVWTSTYGGDNAPAENMDLHQLVTWSPAGGWNDVDVDLDRLASYPSMNPTATKFVTLVRSRASLDLSDLPWDKFPAIAVVDIKAQTRTEFSPLYPVNAEECGTQVSWLDKGSFVARCSFGAKAPGGARSDEPWRVFFDGTTKPEPLADAKVSAAIDAELVEGMNDVYSEGTGDFEELLFVRNGEITRVLSVEDLQAMPELKDAGPSTQVSTWVVGRPLRDLYVLAGSTGTTSFCVGYNSDSQSFQVVAPQSNCFIENYFYYPTG